MGKNLLLIITNRFFAIAQNDIFELANVIMETFSRQVIMIVKKGVYVSH